MHVIARRILREYWARERGAEQPLKAWFHEAQAATWRHSADIKAHYGSASIINAERVVFNIGGNKYRLVARINFASQTVFVRFVGTHREYDRIDVETI